MSAILRLALRSLRARALTASLAVLSIALSAALLLSVERLRDAARASFAAAISDTDVVIGARGGGVQLMLYSVFRIGSATNNFTWESYQEVLEHPSVEWAVPLSLGDSHRGYRVLGTSVEYFERLKYRRGRSLDFASGRRFEDLYDAVLGAEVAEQLGYAIGDEIIVAHGIGDAGFSLHDDKPFTVSGVLERTGTPVDKTVHVSLEAIEAIHVDWRSGAPIPGVTITAEQTRQLDLTPQAITAALVGLDSKLAVFRFQRFVNEYREEPLSAVLPGLALQELWSVLGVAETALAGVSALVVLAALIGMATMLFASLQARRREMAILRSVGARPTTIFGLLMAEAAAIALAGALLGLGLHLAAATLGGPWVDRVYGIDLSLAPLDLSLSALLLGVAAMGAVIGAAPALQAYKMSVSDGVGLRL
ncbi:MAG: FtsX-like permease family protein [Pseudomonadota bacterium]